MDEVKKQTKLKPLGYDGKDLDTAFQFIAKLQALDEDSLQFEEQLNELRLSNVKRLGILRKQQQNEILKQALRVEEEVTKKRLTLAKAALNEEQKAKEAKELAAAKAVAKEQGKKLTNEEKKAIIAKVEAEFQARKKNLEAEAKWDEKNRKDAKKKELADAKKEELKKSKEFKKDAADNIFGKGKSLGDRFGAIKNVVGNAGKVNEDGTITKSKGAALTAALSVATSALANFAKQLEGEMNQIAGKKSAIDTRLQGSSNEKRFGSYWDQMTADITGIAGVSPLVKQSAIADRVATMVSQGISFNVEQRAVLQELSGKIATTFDAANGTLLRLVRIQQQDTTAGRLGMESALTAFLNNMYETTEYMNQLATSVKGSLEEAMALMTGENALSFEYQIQKWLGSLSSVGMSDSAVQGLAGILGKVASGQIDAITGGGQGNLVVMAANNAGLNLSDILADGLDQTTTNTLMNSMVDYLAKIYHDAGDSKVIQQQIASVYGLTASDLKAAVNLSKSSGVVARDGLDYNSAMGRLYSMADSMYSRTSIAEMMKNTWDNLQYSMAAGMVNNPITYGLYQMSNLLTDTTGGIDFALPLVMGSGTAQTFNVAEIMRAGALSGGIISSLAQMIGAGGGGGFTGRGILNAIGVSNGISAVTRGTGLGLATTGGATVSESGSMVGNASSDDVTNKTMTDQTDSAKSETASAVDESDEIKLKDVDDHILNIIDILRNISEGSSTLQVEVKNVDQISSNLIGLL